MKKHLFLEGPIQEGKSTLIRRLIGDHLVEIGGFSSQRLVNESGETVGFRIVPASEAMDLTMKYSPNLSDIFLYFDGEKAKMTPEIFVNTAIRYLRKSKGKKLILLDEIGGVEMLMPEFRQELYQVLNEEIPCLGVLKLEVSNRNMCSNANINHQCVDYYLQLRDALINQYKADLVSFERKHALDTEKIIGDFLQPILK